MASESRTWKLADLARELGGDLQGNPETVICGIAPLDDAGPGQIAVVPGPQVAGLPPNRASAVVLSQTAPAREGNVIRVPHTGTALIALLRMFSVPDARPPQGVDARACVNPSARLGEEARVAPGVFIGAGAVIGNRVTLHPNVYVGDACEIGDDVELLPNVTVHSRTRIGRRVRIRAGTVIGGDGFGYVRDEAGVQHRVPHVGNVEIEDDVEIGANCTVDRATMGTTRIREGTKVDNLVHIAHNVTVGRHGCLVAQVGISGSVRIGDYCTLAGQAGVSDHVTLADHVTVGAKSGVLRDLTAGRWLGAPAIPAEQAAAAYHLLGKLPDLRRRIQALEERLAQLQRTAPPGEGSA